MWLPAECNLWSVEQHFAFAHRCLSYSNTVVKVLLSPGPSAVQQVSTGIPCNRLHAAQACIWIGPERRASIEEHIYLCRHAICHGVFCVHLCPHQRSRNVKLLGGHVHRLAFNDFRCRILQWQMEVHRAKLKAAFPHAADKIQMGGPQAADDIYARATRIAVSQGMPTIHPGDALFNLITFSRTWMRPWAFYSIEDAAVRDQLLRLFPDGCYVAFAGETYCESRNESMEDCWRVMHALPGDGQNRPSVGDSLIDVQERYNTLSNMQAETYEYGIPPIYADPQVLDFDALANQTAEPAAHYPARARPGMSLADGFFQPAPAQVPPDMLRHQQDLIGPIAQFLTGLFPAVFGGEMENVKTASGYAMARDQALGRLGLVWRRLKTFYCDLMLLAVDCFRKNRPGDVEIPFLGAGGEFEAQFIRLANLKGNIQSHPESDETFPRLKSQQRAVLQQLMANPDPTIQAALRAPANLGLIKSLVGLSELVVPGDDARNKQLREIQTLLTAEPLALTGQTLLSPQNGVMATPFASSTPETLAPGLLAVRSTVPVDELLDDHATELEECRRWASSDAGQIARVQNPAGFANVRAHAAEHAAALARQQDFFKR